MVRAASPHCPTSLCYKVCTTRPCTPRALQQASSPEQDCPNSSSSSSSSWGKRLSGLVSAWGGSTHASQGAGEGALGVLNRVHKWQLPAVCRARKTARPRGWGPGVGSLLGILPGRVHASPASLPSWPLAQALQGCGSLWQMSRSSSVPPATYSSIAATATYHPHLLALFAPLCAGEGGAEPGAAAAPAPTDAATAASAAAAATAATAAVHRDRAGGVSRGVNSSCGSTSFAGLRREGGGKVAWGGAEHQTAISAYLVPPPLFRRVMVVVLQKSGGYRSLGLK